MLFNKIKAFAMHAANPFLIPKLPIQKNLLFSLETPIKTYLHLAYATGILAAINKNHPGIINRHINILFPLAKHENAEGDHQVDFCPIPVYGECIKLESIVTRDYLNSISMRSISELICNNLLDEKYIKIWCNYFFIPNSSAYLRFNFMHPALIVGVNQNNRTFNIALYTGDGEFRIVNIPIGLMLMALRDTPAEGKYPLTTLSYIQGEHCIDVESIRRQMNDFLVSRSSDPDDKSCARSYGLQAYGDAITYLINASKCGRQLDLRVTRLLMEQSTLMIMRANALSKIYKFSKITMDHIRVAENGARKMHMLGFAVNYEGGSATARFQKVVYSQTKLFKDALDAFLLALEKSI